MNKVRFGVVGTNFITDWMIAGARQDSRFELTAVCSRSAERAEEFAAKYGIPHKFTSVGEMAECPYVDAVYIAAPNFLHARYSILCMSKGKHVLCEKPLASNAYEARQMIAASEKYNVALMEAMKHTVTPAFRKLRDNIGRTGRARRYFSSYCQYSSRYDAFKAGNVLNAFKPEYSNGSVMDIGVYTIYPMVVLFGRPSGVLASGTVLSSGTDGQGSVIFRYDNGLEASVLYSKIADSYLPSEIQGEDGTILIDQISLMNQVTFTPRLASGAADRRARPQPEDWSVPSDRNLNYHEVSEFIDIVLSGKRESEINSHGNSLAVMELVDEIRRQTGVVFPADTENPHI